MSIASMQTNEVQSSSCNDLGIAWYLRERRNHRVDFYRLLVAWARTSTSDQASPDRGRQAVRLGTNGKPLRDWDD